MLNEQLLSLRMRAGLTQEGLSERSGISVRTIRNLERGQVQRPRPSSVEQLLRVLEPDRRHGPVGPGTGVWRGARPPRTSLVGRAAEVQQLAATVVRNSVVVVTGPGGVGKSRAALSAAEWVGHWFDEGVVVADLGGIPRERPNNRQEVMDQACSTVLELLHAVPKESDRSLLLVLDNTEHVPLAVGSLVDSLLAEFRALHILVTTRRLSPLHGASVWEILPLPEREAADLLLQRVRTTCPTLDLSGEEMRITELCQRLDGIPLLLEFAAHRLRTVSLPALLADRRLTSLLGRSDFALMPHQRTLEASLRWSMAMLDDRQHDLLVSLAHHEPIRLGAAQMDVGLDEFTAPERLELLTALAEASLLQVDRGPQYQYRLLHHVRAFLQDATDWALASPSVGGPVRPRPFRVLGTDRTLTRSTGA
ncbi:helix-turn-helix domain-containing protein [Streptomyces sp. NPDC059651]|uniref:helix-turn-helix domain-containing protein n=1 Tax=Streptomyces sp. NPDC059651 TaxID=3346897 RepID=UPI00368197FF